MEDKYNTFNYRRYISKLISISLLGIFLGIIVAYVLFPYKLINKYELYELLVIDSGFADFFHSIYPIPVENTVRFKKSKGGKVVSDSELMDLPVKKRYNGPGILTKHRIDYYTRRTEMIDLEESVMSDEEVCEEKIKSTGSFRKVDDD